MYVDPIIFLIIAYLLGLCTYVVFQSVKRWFAGKD